MGKPSLTLHAYLDKKAQNISPQLHITTQKIEGEHPYLHHKTIKIQQYQLINILKNTHIKQEKILGYIEYTTLSKIGRMKKSKKNNYRYKDIMDILYHKKLQKKRDETITKPIVDILEEHTEEVPPDPSIRAKIQKRKAKRNKKKNRK